jgi:glycosyltransferase involved in cell wall biosynthesis
MICPALNLHYLSLTEEYLDARLLGGAMQLNRPKVAFFTPLAPQRSGIADYSEELLPYLSKFIEIDVISEGYDPEISPAARQFRIRSPEDFLKSKHEYDTAIYQIANSFDHHAFMIPCMKAMPGILVLHDCCLQYLALGLTARQGQLDTLGQLLRERYGDRAGKLARRLVLNLEDPNQVLFAQPFVAMSRAVIVHSQTALDFVRECAPEKPVAITPMGVPIPSALPDVSALRRQYGYSDDDFIMLSVSTLSKTKRVDVLIRALERVRSTHSKVRLLIVGGGSLGQQARALIAELGLDGAVSHTGWLSRQAYDDHIALGDIVLDVRYPSGGETSASLARAFAAGKPAILSAQQTFLEIPDDVAVKVPVDSAEIARIAAAATGFICDGAKKRQSGDAAKRYATVNCSLDGSARLYADVIQENMHAPVDPSAAEFFTSSHGPVSRKIIATAYKATRLAYLYRSYGLADTWRRVREELSTAVAHA